MQPTLIRMLSTGRVGTKFIAAAFADQGYRAFHENLYEGEPSSAIIQYTRMLGDLWLSHEDEYYALDSDFAQPYIKEVLANLQPFNDSHLNPLQKWFSVGEEKTLPVVVHTGHRLSAATPLIEKEARRQGLSVQTLILFRNPLKTIHAIYTVESPASAWGGSYHNRPSSFFHGDGFKAAAEIWANTYLMAHDQAKRLGDNACRLLNLEQFNQDENYAKEAFDFLGLRFDSTKFKEFVRHVLNQPLRSSKSDSARNSHIFHNASFFFSESEIAEIYQLIKPAIAVYGFDWEQVVREYRIFHQLEKQNLGFA